MIIYLLFFIFITLIIFIIIKSYGLAIVNKKNYKKYENYIDIVRLYDKLFFISVSNDKIYD